METSAAGRGSGSSALYGLDGDEHMTGYYPQAG